MKKMICLMIIVMALMTACTKDELLVFNGRHEYGDVFVEVNILEPDNIREIYIITYSGSERVEGELIEISYTVGGDKYEISGLVKNNEFIFSAYIDKNIDLESPHYQIKEINIVCSAINQNEWLNVSIDD